MGSPSVRAQIWRARIAEWWANIWRWALMAVGLSIGIYYVLGQGVAQGVVTAVAIGVLVIGVALTSSIPLAVALVAMPALLVGERVGLGGTSFTVSDFAVAAAFGAAVLLGHRPLTRPMKAILWFNLIYQFATLITTIVNPYAQGIVEWFHAWMLISGALVVGWALGRGGYARYTLATILVAACVIAVGTVGTAVVKALHGDFSPVYPAWPWLMHKNAAGTVLTFAALIAYVNPPWARLPRGLTRAVLVLLVVAIALTQSRQAWIGLLVAVIIVVARSGHHSRVALLLAIPAAWVTVATVIDQVNSQNRFNSYFQRIDWLREVYAYWKHAPIFGHGLRFWYVDPTVPYQPPQGEVEVVASAGVLGLAAFVVMWVGIIVVLARLPRAYGTLALVVVVDRIVQAQFDLFWVSVQVSVPFVIAGVCLGALARPQSEATTDTLGSVMVTSRRAVA